jgi:hypothetical protein
LAFPLPVLRRDDIFSSSLGALLLPRRRSQQLNDYHDDYTRKLKYSLPPQGMRHLAEQLGGSFVEFCRRGTN